MRTLPGAVISAADAGALLVLLFRLPGAARGSSRAAAAAVLPAPLRQLPLATAAAVVIGRAPPPSAPPPSAGTMFSSMPPGCCHCSIYGCCGM